VHAYTLRAAHTITGTQAGTVRVVQGADGMRIPTTTQSADQNWAVQIGAFERAGAEKQANLYTKADASLGLIKAKEFIIPIKRTNGIIYRARLGQIDHAHAAFVCKTLASQGQSCLVIAPT
ncbi:MAG: SPOR domain-containing protein, partial [Robiginitomaculum sp.]|nr:SPOR domain-containing protein [Robiginitomaculum sp.]